MKKFIAILMVAVMSLSLIACSEDKAETLSPREQAKQKLADAHKEKCTGDGASTYAKLSDDGLALTIDTNPYDSKYSNDYELDATAAVFAVNSYLGFPTSVKEKMQSTRALDGMQSQECGDYMVTWSYHPDNGLKVIYEVNVE